MESELLLAMACASLVTSIVWFIFTRLYMRRITLGTFRFDNSGEAYRCRLDFEDNLEVVEKRRQVVLKVKESDLSLPGTKTQH